MHQQTIASLLEGLRKRQFSSEELTQHFLGRIRRFDGSLNSFITVTPEMALEQARQADRLRSAGGNIPALCGIPIAHKDIFCTRGVKTSCGSKMLDHFISPYNATLIERFHQSGAVMLGKTNMDEFAMGSSNESSYYGPVKNPWQNSHVPGGSSGGAAAAVAARLAPGATGSDTGGSIRQPAAFCGLTGLKPTYGRVSRYGMIAFASSLDQAGPIALTAEDAAILLNVMAGVDERDSTSMAIPVEDYTANLSKPLNGIRIGIPREYFPASLNGEVGRLAREALQQLEKAGATLREITLPHTDMAVPAYYVIAPAEASSNLARFDGVRYGYRCQDPKDLLDLYTRTRAEGFGDEVKRRILVGTYALSAGFYDAYYRKAQKIRRLIKNDFTEAFRDVDLVAGPTTPSPAFRIGEKTADPVQMYLEDIFTIPVNLAGLPAISIPCGLHNNLPIGLQLVGRPFAESQILQVAHRFQQETDWHQRTPNLDTCGA